MNHVQRPPLLSNKPVTAFAAALRAQYIIAQKNGGPQTGSARRGLKNAAPSHELSRNAGETILRYSEVYYAVFRVELKATKYRPAMTAYVWAVPYHDADGFVVPVEDAP